MATSPEPLTPLGREVHRASQVAYWRAQEDSVRQERRQLRLAPFVGLFLSALCGLFLHRFFEAACVGLLGIVIGLMGLYMTAVRLDEFGDRRREAEAELLRVKEENKASD